MSGIVDQIRLWWKYASFDWLLCCCCSRESSTTHYVRQPKRWKRNAYSGI